MLTLTCALVFIHSVFGQITFLEDVSHRNESPACYDKQSCWTMEVESWIQEMQDRKYQINCQEEFDSKDSSKLNPLYAFTKDCQEDGAVWQYR